MNIYNNFPTLDLHGMDREIARIEINDFINDNYKMKKEIIVIVHGIGMGIIRKTTQDTLKSNKKVKEYKIDNFNSGQTIVKLNLKK